MTDSGVSYDIVKLRNERIKEDEMKFYEQY